MPHLAASSGTVGAARIFEKAPPRDCETGKAQEMFDQFPDRCGEESFLLQLKYGLPGEIAVLLCGSLVVIQNRFESFEYVLQIVAIVTSTIIFCGLCKVHPSTTFHLVWQPSSVCGILYDCFPRKFHMSTRKMSPQVTGQQYFPYDSRVRGWLEIREGVVGVQNRFTEAKNRENRVHRWLEELLAEVVRVFTQL